jgi:hypothetical protein
MGRLGREAYHRTVRLWRRAIDLEGVAPAKAAVIGRRTGELVLPAETNREADPAVVDPAYCLPIVARLAH